MKRHCQLVYALRPFLPKSDSSAAFRLWEQCLGETWTLAESDFVRVLKGNSATHENEYWVAEIGRQMVGFVAVQYAKEPDASAGIPLLMVHPDFRRLGIATTLYHKAIERVRETSVATVQLGAGGSAYFFPGVPDNLPEALAFFKAQGWEYTETAYDLVCDLRVYETPPGIIERVTEQGITFKLGLPYPPGGGHEPMPEITTWVKQQICAFESREFPEWAAYFEEAQSNSYMTAWDAKGEIVGTLLISAPQLETEEEILWRGILGEDAGSIGAVGVAEEWQGRGVGSALVAHSFEILKAFGVGNCHIGWTWLLDFYGKLGAKPWRSFSMSETGRIVASGQNSCGINRPRGYRY